NRRLDTTWLGPQRLRRRNEFRRLGGPGPRYRLLGRRFLIGAFPFAARAEADHTFGRLVLTFPISVPLASERIAGHDDNDGRGSVWLKDGHGTKAGRIAVADWGTVKARKAERPHPAVARRIPRIAAAAYRRIGVGNALSVDLRSGECQRQRPGQPARAVHEVSSFRIKKGFAGVGLPAQRRLSDVMGRGARKNLSRGWQWK